MSEPDNRMRWDGRPGHYEVWYLTLNHRPSETGTWIRYTLEAPEEGHGPAYAQLWFAAFDAREPARSFAFHRRFPIARLAHLADPFQLAIGEAVLTHGTARGALEGAGHRARWDLSWTPAAESHRHLPALAYRGRWATTQVLSPTLSALFRGTLTVDDREITLAGEPGCQTHLWGKKHAHLWSWSHCSAFTGRPDAALETLTVRLRRRGFVLPPISLLSLYLGGEAFHFRELPDLLAVRSSTETGRYRIEAQGLRVAVEAELVCRAEELVLTPYLDPDGDRVFCHNTEIADCFVRLRKRQGLGFVTVAELEAPHCGHFEYGGPTADPAIFRRHVSVDEGEGEAAGSRPT